MEIEDIIEVESASERFMGNYGLFSKFLYQFPERSLYEDLEQQLSFGDARTAFETAHAMKGIIGNLSLKLLEPPLFEVVEVLRKGDLPTEEQRKALTEAYRTTVDAIAKLQESGRRLF